MKKKLYCLSVKAVAMMLLMTFYSGVSQAQVSSYAFTQSAGAYTPITGGTVLGVATNDDTNFPNLPLGFTFRYNGVDYTEASVNTNGFLALGTTVASSYTAISSGSSNNIVAGLNQDLQGNTTTGELSYLTIGSAPNRTFVVQWTSYRKYGATGDDYNFQIRLNETTNYIDVVYGAMTNNASSTNMQIGLRGASSADYNNRTTTTNWTATTAGGANSATCTLSSTVFPASGRTFTWIAPPATPPTPTQDPASPTCATGSNIDLAGPAPQDVTWYWQTSATGTSLADPYTGPYTIFANGTYYARAYNTVGGVWSASSSSIVISNFPVATLPPAPTAAQNPACASTSLTMPAPPVGTTYYWQTVVDGSSTANDAATPLTVSATGTYYVSAFESATSCWSSTSSLAVTIGTYTPDAPVVAVADVNACVGAVSAPLNAAPGATSGSAVVSLGTSYTLNPGASATLSGTLNIPAGATITSSVLTFSNVTTTSGTWPSDIGINMTGVSTLSATTVAAVNMSVTNAGPYTRIPTTSGNGSFSLNMTHNYSFGGPATFGDITLTVNYTVPPSVLTWYDAASGGNTLGTGSPFESVGTTVLPNTSTQGDYTFYVGSVTDGCVSPTVPVTVHVTPVLADLIPVNVTCNGGANGSFTLGTVSCGSGTFLYSVDGGAFGAIPTDLTAGTHTVIIQDGAMESAPISLVITQPGEPTALYTTDVTYYNGTLGWTAQGDETTWTVIYGEAGFDPATGGTVVSNATNPYTINGTLSADTDYEFYVFANCGATADTAGPLPFSTDPGFFTYDNACGPGFIDISGTGTALNLTDDATTVVTSGFPLSLQGVTSDQITVSNNGWIQFGGSVTLNAWSLDLDDEEGNVYHETVNVGGENLFIVQWDNRPRFSSVIGQNVTFELIVNETTGEIYYVYDDVVFGGTQSSNDYGAQGTISIDGPLTDITVSSYNATYLTNNSCAHFYNALCPNPTNVTALIFQNEIDLDWNAGLYGETDWTVVYGPAGFDPANYAAEGGFLETTATSDIAILNLQQLNTYDIYIYSECMADNLTSPGLLVTYTTLPWCADPTGLGATTDVDSLEASWTFTAVPGYDAVDFNVMYGPTGFDLYSGTEVGVGSTNTFDTIMDASFLAGGVYQMYVQAVCANDTSNYAGPFTFVMPVSNDTVCGFENLNVDGTVYTFNNNGATVSLNEASVAPPADGAQVTTGWTNSTLNNTTWFTFQAPATGSIRINNTAINYNGQVAVYEVGNCADFATFTLAGANDNEIGGSSVAPNFTICGLTPGATYYLMHDGFNGTTGNYSISILPIDLEAGSANPVTNICTGTDIDLFSTVTGNDAGGTWSSSIPSVSASMNGSTLASSGLAYQVFDFEYRVVDGCAYDSIITQVQIAAPSNAGQDGTINICRNEPFDLLSGLDGSADLNGTWYNPSNQPMASSFVEAGGLSIPGLYNYDYIAGNGVCPNDTANVVVDVNAACNWLGLEDQVFEGVSLYPNPSEGIVFIASDATGAFDYVVTDAKGRVVTEVKGGVKAAQTTEINLNAVETGVYFIRLSNAQAEKVFRVVIQ